MSDLSGAEWPSVLRTERLLLRAPQAADLETVYALHADPVSNRHSASPPIGSREAAAELLQSWLRHWQEQGYGYWAIAELAHPEEVLGFGGIMMNSKSPGGALVPSLYFRIRPSSWGLGYASEMAQATLGLAFGRLHLPAVLALVQPANTPSRKTLERLGLLLKGSIADHPGQPPCLVYELGAQRWASLPKTPPEPTPFGA